MYPSYEGIEIGEISPSHGPWKIIAIYIQRSPAPAQQELLRTRLPRILPHPGYIIHATAGPLVATPSFVLNPQRKFVTTIRGGLLPLGTGSLDHLKPRSVRMVVCVADTHVRAVQARLFLQLGLLRPLSLQRLALGSLALRLVLRW